MEEDRDKNQNQPGAVDKANQLIGTGYGLYKKSRKSAATVKTAGKILVRVGTTAASHLSIMPIMIIISILVFTAGIIFIAPLVVGGSPVAGGELTNVASESASITPTQSVEPGQKPNYVYYSQYEGIWADNPYSTRTVYYCGCAPTSMAMIFSSYGVSKNPGDIATIFHEKNWDNRQGCGTLFSYTYSQNWLNSMGFERAPVSLVKGSYIHEELAKEYLDNGYLLYTAINSGGASPLLSSHQVVIEAIDINNKTITVRDPARHPSRNENGLRTVNYSSITWYSIIPIRIKG